MITALIDLRWFSRSIRLVTCAVAILPGTSVVAAQTSEPAGGTTATDSTGALAEITVTARRRSENLQSVPVTVSAFGDRQFERFAVADATDLSGKSPNVQILKTGAGTGALQVFIRGVGQDALAFNSENPVGIYLDDVYLGRVQGALLDMLDFERVEILRGPQGTLYGRNSTVGALKYITKQPDLATPQLRASVTAGNFRRIDGIVSASVPLIEDKLAFKLDVGLRNQEGYMDIIDVNGKRTGDHLNGADRRNVRLAIRYQPIERLTLDLSGDYGVDRSGSAIGTPVVCVDPLRGPCSNRFGSPYVAGDNGAGRGRNDVWGTAGRATYDLEDFTLKSISSYRENDLLDAIDISNLPGAGLLIPDAKDQHQFSQEFQATTTGTGPFSLTAGLFYFNEFIHHSDTFLGIVQNDDRQNANSYAGYAEANYKVTPKLSVTLGARYSFDDKSIDRIIYSGDRSVTLFTGGSEFSTENFTYKVSADYKFNANALVYMTYATGYRPGSYVWTYPTQSQIADGIVLSTTSTESSRNFELGGKFELFARRLRLNLAAFKTTYKDLQAQSTDFPFPILSKDVDIKGVEVEFEAQPVTGLSFTGSFGYLDSKIGRGVGTGLRQRYTPKVQATLSGEYRTPVSSGTDVFIGANASYVTRFRTDDSFLASVIQPAYALVGGQVGTTFGDGRYRFSIDGKNLTNKVYFLSTNPGSARWFASPRTVAATFMVKY